MRLGLDFDNTLVCYDGVFHRVAVAERLVPPDLPPTKSHVRDYLRHHDRGDDWTRLQGTVYGPRMVEATPYPGVVEFLRWCSRQDWDVAIISHRSRHPYLGPPHDLHAAAHQWLTDNGLLDHTGLHPEHVWFEETKAAKLNRIAAAEREAFVDDLPEFLREPDFPDGVGRVLFDPGYRYPDATDFPRLGSWETAPAFFREWPQ